MDVTYGDGAEVRAVGGSGVFSLVDQGRWVELWLDGVEYRAVVKDGRLVVFDVERAEALRVGDPPQHVAA